MGWVVAYLDRQYKLLHDDTPQPFSSIPTLAPRMRRRGTAALYGRLPLPEGGFGARLGGGACRLALLGLGTLFEEGLPPQSAVTLGGGGGHRQWAT